MKTALHTYGHDNRYFGGVIYPSDFETNHPPRCSTSGGSIIASRIISDKNFDIACSKKKMLKNA